MPQMDWTRLDENCLVKVFQKAGTESLIFSLPFVCKVWHNVLRDNPACWRDILLPDDEGLEDQVFDIMSTNQDGYKSDSENDNFEHFLRRYAKEFHHDRREFTSFQFIRAVIKLSDGCARFLKLPPYCRDTDYPDSLYDTTNDIGEIIEHITNSCKEFYGLHISFAVLCRSAVTELLKYMPKIKHLSLRHLRISRKNLFRLLKGCKHLDYLDLSDCTAFNEGDRKIIKLVSKVDTFICHGSTYEPEVFSDSETHNFFYEESTDAGEDSGDEESGDEESNDDED